MFIVSLTYKVSLEEVDQHIPAHVAFLEQHYANKKFLLSGRKTPRTGGVILMDCVDKDEVEAIVQLDPFYQEQLADYEITEIQPTMSANGLERL